MAEPTLSLICNIVDPITKEPYSRDPRNIAIKAEKYLKSTGIGDTAFFGPEAEFFIFDEVRYDAGVNQAFYKVDSVEGQWNTGREEQGGNLGYKPRYKEGYFPVAPTDSQQDIRTEMCRVMESVGIHVERQHHEVATAGQAEIDIKFENLLKMGDNLQWFKYVIKNVARRHGKTVTFMPKPLYGDNGSGMHVHQSIWKGGKPLFAGEGYAGLSDLAMWYIGGILKHGPALAALCCPTTNSYKRLVPGLRGARQPRLLGPQPLGLDPHPDVLAQPQGEAARVPLAGPVLQRLPGVRGHAHGRPGRHREQDQPRPAARQGHLRHVPRGAEGHPEDAGLAGRGARVPAPGPQVPAQGRRLHRGRHRDLDPVQVRQGSEPGPDAPLAAGVRALLRHLVEPGHLQSETAAREGGRLAFRFGAKIRRLSLRARYRAFAGGLPPVFWVLWWGVVLNRAASFVVGFLALFLVQERGFGTAEAGRVVALYGAGGMLAALVGGTAADRVGRRSTMMVSLACNAAAVAALPFAQAPELLAGLTFLAGAAGQALGPALNAALADVVPLPERPRAFGLVYWAANIGFGLGYAIAGVVGTRSLPALFLLDAATTLAFLGLVTWKVPETRPARLEHHTAVAGLRRVFSDRPFVVFLGLHLVVLLVFTQWALMLGVDVAAHGVGRGGYAFLLWVNCAGAILFQPLLGRWLRRRDPTPSLVASALLFGVGYGLNAVATTLPLYAVGVGLWTLGEVMGPPGRLGARGLAGAARAPRPLPGGVRTIFSVAFFLSPLLSGELAARAGARAVWLACLGAGVLVALGHLAAAGPRRRRLAEREREEEGGEASSSFA